MDTRIWYCSYGSNLLFERFRLYIEGGTASFINKSYQGCTNKTLPKRSAGLMIPYELYFSENAPQWENKGVAFIAHTDNKTVKTYCRIYEITVDQFREIVQQENGLPADASKIPIDFETLYRTGTTLIGTPDEYRWYGKLIRVGLKDDRPIVTFTAKWDMDAAIINPPGGSYLSTIINGLKETFPGRKEQLAAYLQSLKGIENHYSTEYLEALVAKNG